MNDGFSGFGVLNFIEEMKVPSMGYLKQIPNCLLKYLGVSHVQDILRPRLPEKLVGLSFFKITQI